VDPRRYGSADARRRPGISRREGGEAPAGPREAAEGRTLPDLSPRVSGNRPIDSGLDQASDYLASVKPEGSGAKDGSKILVKRAWSPSIPPAFLVVGEPRETLLRYFGSDQLHPTREIGPQGLPLV